jgi:hypothetical protein
MFKIVKADKDTYITNKVIKGTRRLSSNVGAAGTLDLFKIYGATMSGSTPNRELSRILIHFDLSSLKKLYSLGKIDVSHPSFFCNLNLKDVYGGQTTPANFTVSVFPLSSSFDEGIGKDVTYYSDKDVSNWNSSSFEQTWMTPGCDFAGGALGDCDYLTSSVGLASTESTQTFKKGSEDLLVDVTAIISATLVGNIPDSGLRISFQKSLEDNNKTYFVKRFASSNAYDETKHPKLSVGFDDSMTDDSQNLTFDKNCKLTLYNYSPGGEIANIVSASYEAPIVGTNCLLLKMTTQTSSGSYSLFFSGSQLSYGSVSYIRGTYGSTIFIPSSDPLLSTTIKENGFAVFTPVWCSLDGTVAYVTGSNLTVSKSQKTSNRSIKKFIVTTSNVREKYQNDEVPIIRLNIFDQSSPLIKTVKVPIELPGIVLKYVYYQVRDAVSGEVVIPFDDVKNSTKVSSDSSGMFFNLDMSNLTVGKTYCVDVLIDYNGSKEKFLNVSPIFGIEESQFPLGSEQSVLNVPDVDILNVLYVDTLYANNVVSHSLTGSLTTLEDGSPYLISGDYITITTGSNGSITISANTNIVGYLTASFTDASEITVNYSLGTRLYDIEVFDIDFNKIIPKNAKVNSSTQATVSFGSPTTGYVMILGARNS